MVKTIIKCGASWCNPCRIFKITFDKASKIEKYKNINFKEIDIEEDDGSETIVEKYNIKNIPATLILDENDKLIYKVSGNISLSDFTEIIDDAIDKKNG